MIHLLSAIPPKYIIFGVILFAAFAGTVSATWSYRDAVADSRIAALKMKHQQDVANYQAEVQKEVKRLSDKVQAVSETHGKEVEKLVYRDRIVEQKVIEYVENNSDDCELSPGWVRTTREIARDPGLPAETGPAGQSDEGVSGIRASRVIPAAKRQADLYYELRATYNALKEYVVEICVD